MSRRLDAFDLPEKTKIYVKSVLNPFLEEIVRELMTNQPANPTEYMYDFLKKSLHVDDELVREIERLKVCSIFSRFTAGDQLDSENRRSATSQAIVRVDEAAEECEAEDEGFEEFADKFDSANKGRRAVSAEAYGEWNQKKEWVPEEFAKSEEQKQLLNGLLSRSFLFSSLDEADKSVIVGVIEEMTVPEGTTVIYEGDMGDFLFIVEKGSLHCLKQSQLVKVCEAGDVFGELSLLYNAPRAASVLAVTNCVLWKLDRTTFTQIVRKGASKKRQMYVKFLHRVPLLSGMGPYELSQVADALTCHVFGPGEVIVEEGAPGDTFYILEEGTADAFKDGVHTLHYEKAGEYFGELSLLKEEPRRATVKAGASEGCRVLALERRAFNRLLGDLEEFLLKREYS